MSDESPMERIRRLRADPRWRKHVSDNARDMLGRALHDDQDETDALHAGEEAQAFQAGLPVTWHNGDRTTSPVGRSSILTPAHADVKNYAIPPRRVCGECRFFELKKGQQKMARERFLERVVLDEEWSLDKLPPAQLMGVCGQSAGTMATSSVSNADGCPAFRKKQKGRWER